MKKKKTNPYSAHHDIALLLPWYVNHTLRGSELNAVENHLKICLICRRELVNLQKLSLAVNQEGSFDSAALASFSHLKNRIHKTDNSVGQLPQVITNPRRKRYEKFDLKLPVLARSKLALAAVIVLALLVPGHVELEKLGSNDYRTLSDSEISKPRKNEIRVVFSKNANQQQIDTILAKVQGQIVAGPTGQSVYTVRINKVTTTKNMLETVEQLRKNTNILFAEPAYDLLSSYQAESDAHL